MLQLRSILTCADNTGAFTLELIGIPKRSNKKTATVGNVIKCVVKKASPNGSVKVHEKVLAVVIRTKKEIHTEILQKLRESLKIEEL